MAMMAYGWEDNRMSWLGVVTGISAAIVSVAVRHCRLQWFIHLRAEWLTRGRRAPRHTSGEYGTAFTPLHASMRPACILRVKRVGGFTPSGSQIEIARQSIGLD